MCQERRKHDLGTLTRAAESTFDAYRDFGSQSVKQLDPWEQLAQVLLSASEFLFVD